MIEKSLSYIEISKKNLIHNIKEFRNLINKKTKISAVVKANAYGHGDKEVVKILSPYVDYFQVNSIEEFERIKKFTKKPIFIFGYVSGNDISKAIKLNAILTIFDFNHLSLINKISQKMKKKVLVHIAIDSYLGREGFMPDQIEKLLLKLKSTKNIIVDGIYSHFANIEDTNNFSYAQKQLNIYKKICEIFKKEYPNIETHISATSGVLVYEKKWGIHNLVRVGIGLYGMWPSDHLKYLNKKIILKPVLKWISHIAQVKELPADYSIGYGLTYITKKKTKIAVIPQGYFDGYVRLLSNKGEVLIKGKRCKILGRVAMNMFVVDVSKIKNVKAEDEVVLLGQQGNNEITAEEIAEKSQTINYEVTTRINPPLPRIIA